ncbi:hypothetical protein [Methanopyrus sp.]
MRLLPLLIACAITLAGPALAWERTEITASSYVEEYEGDAPNHLSVDVDIDSGGGEVASWFLDGLESRSTSKSWPEFVDRVLVLLDAYYDDGKLRLENSVVFKIHFDYDDAKNVVRVYLEPMSSNFRIETENGHKVLVWEVRGTRGGESGVLKITVVGIDGRGWKVERREGRYIIVHWTAEGEAKIRIKVEASNSGKVLRVIDISWHYEKEERRSVPISAIVPLVGAALAWTRRSSR